MARYIDTINDVTSLLQIYTSLLLADTNFGDWIFDQNTIQPEKEALLCAQPRFLRVIPPTPERQVLLSFQNSKTRLRDVKLCCPKVTQLLIRNGI